jgi:hypothetical protein
MYGSMSIWVYLMPPILIPLGVMEAAPGCVDGGNAFNALGFAEVGVALGEETYAYRLVFVLLYIYTLYNTRVWYIDVGFNTYRLVFALLYTLLYTLLEMWVLIRVVYVGFNTHICI